MFAPTKETAETVVNWLTSEGIARGQIKQSSNKGWLAFDATVGEAEKLLHTVYDVYEDPSTSETAVACEAYHIPKVIQKHIDYITPGVKLLPIGVGGEKKRGLSRRLPPAPHMQHGPPGVTAFSANIVNGLDLDNCDMVITPACIKALYQIPNATKADPSNSIGIFEDGDFYAQQDLNQFFANYTPYIPQGTHPISAFIDGAQAPVNVSAAGGESSLDLELVYPLIYPQTFLDGIDGSYCTYSAYGETGNDPIDPVYPDPMPGGYNGPLQYGVYSPTNVISVSYSQQEYNHPVYYQLRQCNEFMKLALQGHTIVFSSGDTGVAGRAGDPAPNGCLGPDHTIFNPRWPDSCPYLTVVGGTKVYPGKSVFDPESAANDPAGMPYSTAYSTGGGFSNIHSIPDYQTAAVAKQNRSGRGYPDVSANGDNIAVYVRGRSSRSGGTSASTPIFASVINLINEERLAAGKTPVGFINPTLYEHPEVLNDIVNGSNPGCGTNGFSAVPG
ncbi:MAG: hypothetical protein Q9227_002546 [Pyrenula ochraceoflavens]